jgi:hypothetical protein
MFDGPDAVVSDFVSKHSLLDSVMKKPSFGVHRRVAHLQFKKEREFHIASGCGETGRGESRTIRCVSIHAKQLSLG